MAYVRVRFFRPFKTLIPSARKLMMPRHLPRHVIMMKPPYDDVPKPANVERIVVNRMIVDSPTRHLPTTQVHEPTYADILKDQLDETD
jgi:hypothetical protein